MAEILVKAVDHNHSDPEKDLRGCYKKGYIVSIKEDGWSEHPNWAQSAYPYSKTGKFVLVKCSEITKAQADAYKCEWWRAIDYEVLSSNPTNGTYQVRVFGKYQSASGGGALTKTQVEYFLETRWGCTIDGFAQNEVTFTFSLWAAARSEGFWGPEDILLLVGFSLVSYASTTGIGIIDADITNGFNNQNWTKEFAEKQIVRNGGVVQSWDGNTVRFELERSDVFELFKADVKKKVDRIYCRRRFYFEESDVDIAISQGGIITLTKQQVLNKLQDKWAE